MAAFAASFKNTLEHEGGYVNDPDDAGGETYKGISRKYNPGWLGWGKLDAMKNGAGFPGSLEQDAGLRIDVGAFYKQHYWDKFWGDDIPNQGTSDELFDTAVNMGAERAVTFLQQALNFLNRNGTLYSDLVVDGVFGRKTLEALQTYLQNDNPEYLLKIMNILQGKHYLDYMTKSPTQEKYARGWLNRVEIRKA
jgi:lysozyme family protein